MQRVSRTFVVTSLLGTVLNGVYIAGTLYSHAKTWPPILGICERAVATAMCATTSGKLLNDCMDAMGSHVLECVRVSLEWPTLMSWVNAALVIPLLFLLSHRVAKAVGAKTV